MKAEYGKVVEICKSKSRKEFLQEELSIEIGLFLNKFPSKKEGYEELSRLSGLTARTIRRYTEGDSYPTRNNALRLFKSLNNDCTSAEEFQERLAPEIFQAICDAPDFKSLSFEVVADSNWFNSKMKEDSVFRRLFNMVLMSNDTNPLSLGWVRFKLGEVGLDTLKEMETNQIIKIENDNITLVNEMVPSWDDETLGINAIEATRDFFDPSNLSDADKKLGGIWLDGITQEAYEELIELEKEYFKKVQEKCANNKGNVRFYRSVFLDKVS